MQNLLIILNKMLGDSINSGKYKAGREKEGKKTSRSWRIFSR